jgi:hypothetical protein
LATLPVARSLKAVCANATDCPGRRNRPTLSERRAALGDSETTQIQPPETRWPRHGPKRIPAGAVMRTGAGRHK